MTADPASSDAGSGFGSRPAAAILASVWALTLIALAALVIWLELTYAPAPPAADAASSPEQAQSEAKTAGDQAATRIADAPPEASSDPGGGDTSATVEETAVTAETTDAVAQESERQPAEIRLAPAPAPDLIEQAGADLLLPVAGPAGRAPWKEYSRPYLGDPDAPKIAIVIQGIGLDAAQDRAAIETLPPEVVLAISPYARTPQEVADRARAAGHEVLLMLPMEPLDYPANDPGPLTLLVDMPKDELVDRLHRILGRFQGYVGIVNHMGSRFTAERAALEPIMDDMTRRGLLLIDARSTADSVMSEVGRAAGLPALLNDRYIDNEVSAAAIDGHLDRLLRISRERGAAVGIGRPYPVTLDRIAAFARKLEESPAALAPVSALVGDRRDGPRAAAR